MGATLKRMCLSRIRLPRASLKTACLGAAIWLVLGGCGSRGNASEPQRTSSSKGSGKTHAGFVSRPAPELQADLRVGEEIPDPPTEDAPTEAPMPFHAATEAGSHRVVRPVAVYGRPDMSAPPIGAIKEGTLLSRVARVTGQGCTKGFLALGSGAYVCLGNLSPDRRPPKAERQPTLGANNLTPGTYGFIRTGGTSLYPSVEDAAADRQGEPIQQSDTVRWAGKRTHQGKHYWRITTGQIIRGDRVRRFWPSKMRGVNLREEQPRLPLVFMVSSRLRKIGETIPPVNVHARPGGALVTTLPRYSAWPVDRVTVVGGARWYQIPDKGWVASEMVRVARKTDPPPGLHPAERWIDVDLEEQTLVAYRGRAPVYAALVSAGVWKYPTPVGVFRIYHKVAEADMRSEPSSDETYRVDHVPWAMYFKDGYALHGAYWHDGFGHARSHGCINLSPKDAELIYHFVRPAMPDGWTRLLADERHPGTAIRIRGRTPESQSGPEPTED